jgi:hypothetical protein
MKRRFPRTIWYGLLLVLAAPLLYGLVLIRFPVTRDVPWMPLLMIAAGLTLLVRGMRRARRDPATYRGRVLAPIALAAAVVIGGLFTFAILIGTRQIPASAGAPRVGQPAPGFTLPDQDGRPVSLAQLIAPGQDGAGGGAAPGSGNAFDGGRGKPGGTLLVFYRGYW